MKGMEEINTDFCIECKKTFQRYRGLCRSCYDKQRALLRAGKITDQELVDQGKRLPKVKMECFGGRLVKVKRNK